MSIISLNAAIAALRRDNDKKEERREERMLRKRQKLLNTADNMRVFNAEQLLLNLICDKSVYKMVQRVWNHARQLCLTFISGLRK